YVGGLAFGVERGIVGHLAGEIHGVAVDNGAGQTALGLEAADGHGGTPWRCAAEHTAVSAPCQTAGARLAAESVCVSVSVRGPGPDAPLPPAGSARGRVPVLSSGARGGQRGQAQ